MREKRAFTPVAFKSSRITPACAGKTLIPTLKYFITRDHPRVCGKNVTKVVKDIAKEGSPPRVREKRTLEGFEDGEFRITPACAGKTL